jgi:hypothetical protein
VSFPLVPLPVLFLRPFAALLLAALVLDGIASLLAPLPVQAADELRLQLDGLELPIDLVELEAFTRQPKQSTRPGGGNSDLGVWLNLLQPQSRRDLIRLLQAPLLQNRSFGQQLLNSWTGEQILKEAGGLLTVTVPASKGQGPSTAPLLLASLRQLLQGQGRVSTLAVLRSLPVASVTLRIDGALELASQWRSQLQRQNGALAQLRQLGLPRRRSRPLAFTGASSPSPRRLPQRLLLSVPHRATPLPLELWPAQQPRRGPWLLLMPGLGGSPDQLSWLACCWSIPVATSRPSRLPCWGMRPHPAPKLYPSASPICRPCSSPSGRVACRPWARRPPASRGWCWSAIPWGD